MTYPKCPKCGWVADIEDECPKCGIYVSKYLAVQQRRATGEAPLPVGLGGAGPTPGDTAPATSGGGVASIAIWAAVVAVFALVGYVVLVDWFGKPFAYVPPPGWRAVDDDAVKRSVEAMSPQARDETEFYACYTPGGSTASQSAIAVLESERTAPMTEQAAATIRDAFHALQGRPQLAGTTGRADLVRVGGRPAIEIELGIRLPQVAMSMLQEVIGTERSTFLVIYLAPAASYDADLPAVRDSLATFRILRAEGLRGNPYVKYGLRWGWIGGLLVLGFVAYGKIRNRA